MKPYLLFSLIISWALLSAIVKHDHQNVDHASLCTDTILGVFETPNTVKSFFVVLGFVMLST